MPTPDAPAAPPSLLGRLWGWPLFQLTAWLLVLWGAWRLTLHLGHLLTSVLVALLIAHLAEPLLRRAERRGISRPLAITGLVLALLGLLAGVLPLLVAAAREVQALGQGLPQAISGLEAGLRERAQQSPALTDVLAQFDAWRAQNTPKLQASVSAALGQLLSPRGALVSGVLGAAGWLGRLFVTLIIAIYMMSVYPAIGPALLRLLPVRAQGPAADVAGHLSRAVGGYFRGQLTVALIMGAIVGTGLTVIGVPSALAIGVLAALLNVVPYLGVVLSIIPALLLAAPLGAAKVLLTAGLFLAANQLEGHVIAPRVMGQSTHLSPLSVLLSILAGVELFGLAGAVIAVPAVATARSLLEAYYYPSRAYRAQRARPVEPPPSPRPPVREGEVAGRT